VCSIGGGPGNWSRQPSGRDLSIVDHYLDTLRMVRTVRPGAPVKESVVEVTHRLRTISTCFDGHGLDGSPYRMRLDQLSEIAPDVDVSGVLWN
jgi:hypothetical protein